MSTVVIACSNPGGLVFPPLPDSSGNVQVVTLAGAPFSPLNDGVELQGFGLTEVDAAIWAAFSAMYASNPIIASGAVWEV